jgi:hypothetical protein
MCDMAIGAMNDNRISDNENKAVMRRDLVRDGMGCNGRGRRIAEIAGIAVIAVIGNQAPWIERKGVSRELPETAM